MHSLSIVQRVIDRIRAKNSFDTAKATKAPLWGSDIGKTGWVVLVEE